MTYLYKKIVLSLSILAALSSCSSFLEETPDNRLRLDSYEKVAELVANAYPEGSGIFMEWMSDNVGSDPKNLQRMEMTQAYKWQNIEQEGQDTPSYYWSSNYMAIAHANQALLTLEEVNEHNPEYKKAIRGEALACRAFAHFMLVSTFAKCYDPVTAASDKGIVIMTEPESTLLATYERSSVKEVYDFIEKDLLEAMDLVSDQYYKNSGKYHFNRSALLAFATRFFLFKKDYINVEKYATELLGADYNTQMIRDYSQVYTGTSSEIMARKFADPTLRSNLLLIRKDVLYGYKAYSGYRFNQEVYESLVLTQKDLRFSVTYGYGGAASFLPKFQRDLLRKTSITSSTGYPYTIEVAFRAEEAFFNRLEAWAMLGATKQSQLENQFDRYLKSVYAGSLDYALLLKNYEQFYPGLTKEELRLQMVLDEKRREFVEEGIRWFDICRHKLTVKHTDIQGVTSVLQPEDPRKVIQIPQTAILYGGLHPNERETTSEPKVHLIIRN